MGYLVKATIGAALFIGGIVLFNVKLLALLDIGTCASGNVPYEIQQGYECPEGTGTDVLLLFVSIIGGLIGAAIFAFRGDPPWGSGRRRMGGIFGLGTFAWGLFFTATGATMLIASLTDDSLGADSDLGGKIVGITFLAMGLPALLIALWSLVKSFGRGDERPAAATAGGGSIAAGGIMGRMRAGLDQAQAAQSLGSRMRWGSGGGGTRGSGDAIGKIERLQKLRESGAINDTEFEQEKAKILAEQ
jgi:putative oligomerization/nucleic acid binding protein